MCNYKIIGCLVGKQDSLYLLNVVLKRKGKHLITFSILNTLHKFIIFVFQTNKQIKNNDAKTISSKRNS